MTAIEQVDKYLRQLTLRVRLLKISEGVALLSVSALLLTVVFVFIANRYEFSPGLVTPLRVLLFLATACVVVAAIGVPLSKLNRKRVVRIAERLTPGYGQQLLTVAERRDANNPFNEVIAENVLRVARENGTGEIAAPRRFWSFLATGGAVTAVLVWLIVSGPGYWGYGASLLWTGSAHGLERPLYDVAVQPGNKTIRRKSNQVISAQLIGFSARDVVLHARYGNGSWQQTSMQPSPGGNGYQFLFGAVSDAVEYYVQADSATSKRFKISVKDLPAVKRVRVRVHFPEGLNLQDASDDSGGDIRAVSGSRAQVSVLTDRPLDHGVLVFDKGKVVPLSRSEDGWMRAELPITEDGAYHVAAIDGSDTIRISEDYFIEAKKDEPPTVRILRPGNDPKVSPIEEVPVTVEAADDFGIKSLDLHYSVNGGAERVARFKSRGGKEEQGHTTLYLEDFKLAPGDVVSMYASATDANKTTQSDILFAQAEAFDYKFSQSQQSGGGGGGGGGQDNNNISARQKQIIAATFNELRGESKSRSTLTEQAHFLSETEAKLGAQAKTLAERMGNRELSQANPEFEKFTQLMTFASSEMNGAVEQLTPGKWKDALVPEQKALQSLLRAEALFRDIQVAFGQRSGGGGGGGAERELARMFDLELDTSKNQYETGQSASDMASQQQKDIDKAFERLQMLARRQQELAEQRNGQQPAEQRWQEEQLRREAEELKRQIEQLSQNSSGQSQTGSQNEKASSNQGSQSGSQSSGASSGRRMAGQQDQNMAEAMKQTREALNQAEDEMRKAVSGNDASAQERAANRLSEAQRQLSAALHRNAGTSLSNLTQQADAIANAQKELANRMKQTYGHFSDPRQTDELSSILGNGGDGSSGEMPEMNDPDNPRFGYGYRRRNWLQEARPLHNATEGEKSLAGEKERLAQQLRELQEGMQQQEQGLRGTSPDAATKVRKALSEAESKELALRMEKDAQWIREGYGDRNLGMEDSITTSLDTLRHDLHSAQQSIGRGDENAKGGSDRTADALAQVQQLRSMLEQARRSEATGTPSQGSNRQQAESGEGNGQVGKTGDAQSDMRGGSAGDASVSRQDLRQAIGNLSTLRGQISGEDRALGNYLGGSLGYLRDLNADPNVLQSTIGQDAISSLERLEAELSRRLGEQQNGGARSGATETPSDKYRDAVAQYFKKLSQPPPK